MRLFRWFGSEIRNIKMDAYAVSLFFILQFIVWFFISQKIKPDFTITPLPPTRIEMDITSLGDSEFAYRMYGQLLQNAGDTFGETIPLQNYDFSKLEKWFFAVDKLSPDSEYIPSIAAFYYGQSQNTEDCRYVIKYLTEHADNNPSGQWRWYMEAIYLAAYRMKNYDLAQPIAEKLIAIKSTNIPLWAKTMVPFMMQKKGDVCSAYKMLRSIDENELKAIAEDDILSVQGGVHNFMLQFILDKINAVKNNPQLLIDCMNTKALL